MFGNSDEEKPMSTTSFYSSNGKGYIPILERKRKLESSFETPKKHSPDSKPSANQAKRSKSENRSKKTPNGKVKKKNSKPASKKSPVLSNSSKQNIEKKSLSAARFSHQKLPSETVSLNSVLTKKEPSVKPENRRFFKSRSSELSGNVLLRVENIIPKNSKSILDLKNKENRSGGSLTSPSTKDVSKSLKNVKSTPSKWVVDSFAIDTPKLEKTSDQIENRNSFVAQDAVVSEKGETDKLLRSDSEQKKARVLENKTFDDSDTKNSNEDSGCLFADDFSGNDSTTLKKNSSDSDCFVSSALDSGISQLQDTHDGETSGNCEQSVDIPPMATESDSLKVNGLGDVYPVFRCAANRENMSTDEISHVNDETKVTKRNRLSKSKLPKEEMFSLDAGQDMAPVVCQECPIMYQKGSAQDERFHEKIHQKYTSIDMKFQGWKKERVIGDFLDGKIIMVTKDDKNYMIEKSERILDHAMRELGISNQNISFKHNDVFLLYIHIDAQIIGCLLAEPISKAYYVKGQECTNKDSEAPAKNEIVQKTSSSEPVKAVCGVNVLWVAQGYDKEIATRLVDCLRCNFAYGFLIQNDQLAFSDASDSLLRFATMYTKKDNFLIYK